MLCRDTVALWSEIHIKHTNALCGQNVVFLNVKPGGTSCHYCAALILNVYLLLRLRMCGAVPPLPLCGFIMWIGTTLPLTSYGDNKKCKDCADFDTISYIRRVKRGKNLVLFTKFFAEYKT